MGQSSDGAKLYARQQLVLPYENRLWAVASLAKGEKDKYVVHSFEQDLNTGTYEYSLKKKIRSRSVSFESGRSLFTRDEAIDVIGQMENIWRQSGYYQTGRQPPAEKLAANLSGPTPSA